MKANELRIGNYLLNNGVVVKIDARSIFDIWDDKGLKKYEPIRITPQWLVSNGFEHTLGGYHHIDIEPISSFDTETMYIFAIFHKDTLEVGIAFEREDADVSQVLDIEFVHQIQNLYFSLSNTELCAEQ